VLAFEAHQIKKIENCIEQKNIIEKNKKELVTVRKLFLIICLTFLIVNVAFVSIDAAQKNSSTPVETQEQAFSIGPTVTFQSFNSEINTIQNGTVELFLKNPSLNNVTLEVDMNVSVPSDVHIYSEDGSMSGEVGTVNGHFSVLPGSSKTVTLHIIGERTGTFSVHSNINYWPDKNKNYLSTMSQDSSFEVTQFSNSTQSTPRSSHDTPGLGVASSILILMMLCILRRK